MANNAARRRAADGYQIQTEVPLARLLEPLSYTTVLSQVIPDTMPKDTPELPKPPPDAPLSPQEA